MGSEEKAQLDAHLRQTEGHNVEEVLNMYRRTDWTIADFKKYMEGLSIHQLPGNTRQQRKFYRTLFDYALPLTLHSYDTTKYCQAFYKIIKETLLVPDRGFCSLYFQGLSLRDLRDAYPSALDKYHTEDDAINACRTGQFPVELHLFVAPAHSRAYPAHKHGIPNHTFLLILAGEKHVVTWDESQAQYLYPLQNSGRTEYNDEIYQAEGILPDFDAQPLLAKAQGQELRARTGDMIYIPPNALHQVENTEDVLAVGTHLEFARRREKLEI